MPMYARPLPQQRPPFVQHARRSSSPRPFAQPQAVSCRSSPKTFVQAPAADLSCSRRRKPMGPVPAPGGASGPGPGGSSRSRARAIVTGAKGRRWSRSRGHAGRPGPGAGRGPPSKGQALSRTAPLQRGPPSPAPVTAQGRPARGWSRFVPQAAPGNDQSAGRGEEFSAAQVPGPQGGPSKPATRSSQGPLKVPSSFRARACVSRRDRRVACREPCG